MNQSKRTLSLLSIIMLSTLSFCIQTENDTNEQPEMIVHLIENEFMNNDDDDDAEITRRYQTSGMIKLFIYPSCPYCQKVMTTLRDSGNMSKILILDASIPKYLAELKRLTNGNMQCPFIFDEEKNIKMYESKDIIKYFQKRFIA